MEEFANIRENIEKGTYKQLQNLSSVMQRFKEKRDFFCNKLDDQQLALLIDDINDKKKERAKTHPIELVSSYIEEADTKDKIDRLKQLLDKMEGKYAPALLQTLRTELELRELELPVNRFGGRKIKKSVRKSTRKVKKSVRKSNRKVKKSVRKSTRKVKKSVRKEKKSVRKNTRKVKKSVRKEKKSVTKSTKKTKKSVRKSTRKVKKSSTKVKKVVRRV